MSAKSIRTVSTGLLTHLHLSASEAAVMVDNPSNPRKLVVHIFNDDTARRVERVSTWRGLAVRFITGGIGPQFRS